MNKKIVFLFGILILLCAGLLAQNGSNVGLRLISPVPDDLSTTTTVTPTLEWERMMNSASGWVPEPFGTSGYVASMVFWIYFSETTSFADTPDLVTTVITNHTDQIIDIPLDQALKYDTIYFWYIRQFNNTMEETPSEIGSFKTPPMSVVPVLSWEVLTGSVQYQIQIVEFTENYPTNTVLNYPAAGYNTFEVPLVGADILPHYRVEVPLLYNTQYKYRVRRGNGNGWVEPPNNTFTTKPLNVVSELWEINEDIDAPAPWTPLSMYQAIEPNIEPSDIYYRLRYTAITDEFDEELKDLQSAPWFKITTNITAIPDQEIYLDYATDDADSRMRVTGLFAPVLFGDTDTEDEITDGSFIVYITNDQDITMLFEYGSPFIILTDIGPGAKVELIGTVAVERNTGTILSPTWVSDTMPNLKPNIVEDEIRVRFDTDSGDEPPLGSSLKVIVKNMDNGQFVERYAFGDGSAEYYELPLTKEELNEWFYASDDGDGLITQSRPIRISVYAADYPQYPPLGETFTTNFDFIWLGYPTDLTPITATTGVTLNKRQHDRTEIISFNFVNGNQGWVRIVSNNDPVGFVMLATAQVSEVFIGDYTDPQTFTIRAFIGTNDSVTGVYVPNYVWATPLTWDLTTVANPNPPISPPGAIYGSFDRTEIVSQTVSAYSLLTPSNNLTGEQIFQYFAWTSAFSTGSRDWDGITHYRFRMSTTFSDFTATTFPPHDEALGVWDIAVTETSMYLGDLDFGTTHYWRVDVMPIGQGPSNMGGLPAWQFTTMPDPGSNGVIGITGTINADRTLRPGTNYHFFNDPVIGPNATLTIPEGVTITFAPNTTLLVQGNIVIEGDSGDEITLSVDPPTSNGTTNTWGGILFDGSIPRDPNAVDSKLDWVIFENAINPISVTEGGTPVNIDIDNTTFINVHNGIEIGNNSSVKNTSFGGPTVTAPDYGFADVGTSEGFAIKGGVYFENIYIDGLFIANAGTPPAPEDHFYLGSGIITSNPNAQIIDSTIKNVKGNGIWIDTPTPGEAVVHNNDLTGIGTEILRNDNAVIWSNPGATVTNNKIGNWDINIYTYDLTTTKPTTPSPDINLNADERNFGYAIRNGHLIRGNLIAQNLGPGAILADVGAEILNNRIYDNQGFGIQNGAIIQNNIIENNASDAAMHPAPPETGGVPIFITDAITADPLDANVSFNTITDHVGYAIRYGSVIVKNTIDSSNSLPGTNPVENQYAIFASIGATVDENTIDSPVGYGIRNGAVISNNIITAGGPTQEGAYGIFADVGTATYKVEVTRNKITGMPGTAITNGSIIQGNEIRGGLSGILAQDISIVDANEMNRFEPLNTTDYPFIASTGFAIHGGKEITLNRIENYTLNGNGLRGDQDVISSPTMEIFNFNTIINNTAQNGSIFEVYRPGSAITLEIIGNTFTNNRYRKNTLRLHSADLRLYDNIVQNDIRRDLSTNLWIPTTGGPLGVATAEDKDAVAIYVLLHPTDPVYMEGNIIRRHQGNVNGAALYIESASPSSQIYLQNENAISDNHATGVDARGAAVYHHSGTVFLGPDMSDFTGTNPDLFGDMKGNTITANSVPNINPTGLDYDDEQIKAKYAGAAIHVSTTGAMYIYRNIIASNHGNWAIFGIPQALVWNNLYQNTFNGNEEEYLIITEALRNQYPDSSGAPGDSLLDPLGTDGTVVFELPDSYTLPPGLSLSNRGANFKYEHSSLFPANNNFWGQRYDLAVGSTIFHQPNQQGLGQVVYQHPMLPGSHQHTPSLVSGVRDVLIVADVATVSLDAGTSVRTLTHSVPYDVVVRATDSNEFTRDFTEVTIQNTNNQYFIEALLLETDVYSHIYYTTFRLGRVEPSGPGTPPTVLPEDYQAQHCLVNNILPVEDGDTIVFISKLDPTKRITLEVDFSNRLMVYPSLRHIVVATDAQPEYAFNYGEWEDGETVDKRFTFTNGGGVSLTLSSVAPVIQNGGFFPAAAQFTILNRAAGGIDLPLPGTVIPPNGSFDVIVRYTADHTGAGITQHTAYLVVYAFNTNDSTQNASRTVLLRGFSSDTAFPTWDDDPEADFFGPKVVPWVQYNQMVIQARARIVNSTGVHAHAPFDAVVAAYVNVNGREELRGWSRVYNTQGNVSLTVNTADLGETIYFKVYDPAGPTLYDTPRTYDVASIPGGSIGGTRNGPIPIIGAAVVALEGYIENYDGSEWAEGLVGNDYSGDSYGSASVFPDFVENGDHWEWITDSDGNYRFGMWAGHGLTLNPHSSRLNFHTTNFDPNGSVSPRQIKPNNIAEDSPWDTQFSVYINDAGPIFSQHPIPPATIKPNGLNFESTLRVNFLAGRIYLADKVPYTNGEFTIILNSDLNVDHKTNEFGYFTVPIVHGGNVQALQITAAQFASSGYGDIQTKDYYQVVSLPDDPTAEKPVTLTLDISTLSLTADKFIAIEYILSPLGNAQAGMIEHIERTQKQLLRPGWNLLSFNLDFPPDDRPVQRVFRNQVQYNLNTGAPIFSNPTNDPIVGHIVDVRNATYGWVPGALSDMIIGYETGYQSHYGGYFVRTGVENPDPSLPPTPLPNNIYMTATSVPRFNPNITILGNNWNLVGYSPGRIAQTRAMVANDPDIEQIVNESWVFFQEEDHVGASTMRYMNPTEGFWIQNASTTTSELNIRYNTPDYNNVLKRFWLNTQNIAGQTQSHAFGIIEDQYLGYPMRADASPLGISDLIIGQTYKILPPEIDPGTSTQASVDADIATNAPIYRLAGAITGLPGEIFTVINTTGLGTPSNDQARNIQEPKRIQVNLNVGLAISGADSRATFEYNQYAFNQIDPPFVAILNETQYDTSLMVIMETQGWLGFMTSLASYSANDLSTYQFESASGPHYIIFSDKNLKDNTTWNSASIVVYRVEINSDDTKYPQLVVNEDDELEILEFGLFGVSLRHEVSPGVYHYFDGIQVGNSREYVISLPIHEDLQLNGKLFFDTRGYGTYVALAPGSPNAISTNLIISGGNDPQNIPNITDLGQKSMRRLWVLDDDTTPLTLNSSEAYTIRFIRLPMAYNFTYERVDREPLTMMAMSDETTDASDPFGIIQVKPNSHFVIANIHAKGYAISPDYVLAAYVGDELRGKAPMFNASGKTWTYPLISTVDPDEEITFKIWRNGEPIRTLKETIQAIPGGTTGSIRYPFVFDFEDGTTDEGDETPEVFINELRSNYPNPFNPSTTIRFSLKEEQHASIKIYNVRGQYVATLVDDILERGNHEVIWHGVNDYGRQVGSGVYFIRMQTDGYTRVNRAMLLK